MRILCGVACEIGTLRMTEKLSDLYISSSSDLSYAPTQVKVEETGIDS